MSREEMKAKIDTLFSDYREGSIEDISLIAEEWVKLGQGNLSYEEKIEDGRLLSRIGNMTHSHGKFNKFMNYLSEVSFEDSVNIVYNLQSDDYMGSYLSDLLQDKKCSMEKINKGTIRKIDEILKDPKKQYHWYGRDHFYAQIKNIELSKENRERVNKGLDFEGICNLEPQFHDLRTIRSLLVNARKDEEVAKLKYVFEYIAKNDAAYYRLLGSGKKPDNYTAIIDSIVAKATSDYPSDKKVPSAVRKHFIMLDILEGRGDKLNDKDVVSVMNEGDGTTLMDRLSVEKLSSIYNWIHPKSAPQELLAMSKFLAVEGKSEYDYENLLRIGRDSLARASKSKEGLAFMEAARRFINKYRESKPVKDSQERIARRAELSKDNEDRYKEYTVVSSACQTVEQFQNIWKDIKANTAEGQEGVSERDLLAVVKEAIDNSDKKGVSPYMPMPEAKLPLLFGRKKAKEKQEKLKEAVGEFRRLIEDKRKMRALKDLDITEVFSEEIFNSLKANEASKLAASKEATSAINAYDKTLPYGYDREKKYADEFLGELEKIEKSKKSGDKEFDKKKERLDILRGVNEQKAYAERGKKRSERNQPPKTADEKREAAKNAYEARKKAVSGK